MIYVTYNNVGELTGCYRQKIHPLHVGIYIEVPDDVANDWTSYRANEARDGVEITPYTPKAPTLGDFDAALTNHLDATAQSRHYDNRINCALRAGYPGPYQAEGIAFAQWMDACNVVGYTMLADFQAGLIPQPTIIEMIAALPVMVWPE